MRVPPAHQVNARAVNVWRVTGAITALFFAAVPAAYFFLQMKWTALPDAGLYILTALALLLLPFELLVVPVLRYRTWRYEITAEEVYLQHGVIVIKRVLIPMTKVQHVDTSQGPILRAHDLASVTVFSGAGKHEIPALTPEEADHLRDKIARFAKVVDDDV